LLGRQGAIRDDGVAVQVGVEDGIHKVILDRDTAVSCGLRIMSICFNYV
jgi:LytS/YehU family sensor histidine kinase